MIAAAQQKLPNGVTVYKWADKVEPTQERVAAHMKRFGFESYDLQTVPPWFERSRHSHDEEEIRGAVEGVITFHFDEGPVTLEAGDILIIPAGVAHEVITHNPRPFTAFKGSRSGVRSVTEHGDGRGSVEDLASRVLLALDLDGTLEDSRDDMVASVLRVRDALGLAPRSGDEFYEHVNRGMPHLYATAFGELASDADAFAEAERAYLEDYAAHIADKTTLYPGIAEALPQLAQLGRLALVTNKPEDLSDRLLRALGVREHFAVVIGGDTCAEGKPSALPLRTAAERVDISPDEAAADSPRRIIMIGDSAGDVRCGRAAGATVVWCAWGYKGLPEGLAPDHTAQTPADLPAAVRAALSE